MLILLVRLASHTLANQYIALLSPGTLPALFSFILGVFLCCSQVFVS